MKARTSRMIGLLLLVVAVAFVLFALSHPEASFPWSNGITYFLYLGYLLVMVVLLIAPFHKK